MTRDANARLLTIAVTAVFAVAAVPAALSSALAASTIVPALLLGIALCALAIIDLQSFRLPDVVTIPLLGLGLVVAAMNGTNELIWSGIGAAVGGSALLGVALLYRAWRDRDGLGLGDVKLFAAAGAWVGVAGLPSVLLVACVSALLAVGALIASGRKLDAQSAVPFGPFLAFGLWIVWLYGPLSG